MSLHMNTTSKVDIQHFTRLPVRMVVVADKLMPDIIVRTPHAGECVVHLKSEHYPFLFGSAAQLERHADEVLGEVLSLERAATNFLYDQWLKKNP